MKEAPEERIAFLSGVLRWGTFGVLALLVLLASSASYLHFRKNPSPTLSPAPEMVPCVKKTATQEEVAKTKENLASLREAIKKAHETTWKAGFPSYPSIEDLGMNSFDLDGPGPGTARGPIVPPSLWPLKNLVTTTDQVVVLEYCNEVPTQETLTGDISDWHYCPDTGRIFACGGCTSEPTLTW